MSKAEWMRIVAGWRKKYPLPPVVKGQHDPTKVRASTTRCGNCGRTGKITRHHRGHEYYFALLAEELYAERYIQFHPDDVIPLCRRCHTYIHSRYKPVLNELKLYIYNCHYRNKKPEFKALEAYRQRMIVICDKWLERAAKARSRKPKP